MSDDIVKRLEQIETDIEYSDVAHVCGKAAEIIERLRAELAAEREANEALRLTIKAETELQGQLQAELAAAHGTADDIYKKVMEARAERGALLGLLREAHVKMVENNLWRNLRARIDALLNKGGGDD